MGPVTKDAHQTLNFLREGSITGDLYIAGARGRILANRDEIDLYKIQCVTADETIDLDSEPGEDINIIPINVNKAMTPRPAGGGDEVLNFANRNQPEEPGRSIENDPGW